MSLSSDPTQVLSAYGDSNQIQTLIHYNAATLQSKEKKIRRRKFSPEEDEILRSIVTQCGSNVDWSTVASHFRDRTARQCRDRWKLYLSPSVCVGNWTEEEEQLLIRKVEELGNRWALIAQTCFPQRTDIGVKNHYISIHGKRKSGLREKIHQKAMYLPLLQGDLPLDGANSVSVSNVPLTLDLPIPPVDDQANQMAPIDCPPGLFDPKA